MITLGKYQVCVLDLFTDATGKLSSSKCWFNAANVIMSKVMLSQTNVDWELLSAYGAVVGGSHVASTWLKLKYGANNVTINDVSGQ